MLVITYVSVTSMLWTGGTNLKRLKSILKRGMAMLLLTSTLVGVLPGGGVKEARADSNDLRQAYIQLMSGASAVNVDAIDELSVNDLRVIALYLSNFYIPYSTSLDDTNQQEKNEQHMVNALKSIGFKDDTARSLIKTVYSASLSSAKELYICEEQLYGGSVEAELGKSLIGQWPTFEANTDVALGLSGTGFSFEDFLGLIKEDSFFGIIYKSSDEGRAVAFTDKIEDKDNNIAYYPLTMFAYNALPERYNNRFSVNVQGFNFWNFGGGEDGGRIPIQFFWSKGGVMKPCFELNDFTSSFIKEFADAVDLSDGSGGMSILSTSCEDFVTLKEKEQKALCTLTQRLYVDWVGNILCDFGNRRVIIYPACMNPYAFDMISDEDDSEASENEPEGNEGIEAEAVVKADRKSVFSLISSWGFWFMDKLEIDTSKDVLGYQGGGSSTIELKMYTGSGVSASWNDKKSSTGASKVKNIISNWGYSTGEFKDGSWFGMADWGKAAPELSLYSFDFSVDKSAVLSEVLTYTPISAKELSNINNGSMFVTADIIDIGGNYFTQSNKFTTKSENFSGYMQFTDQDYTMLKNIFLTYSFAYHNRNSSSFDQKKNYINMKFCADNFPESMDTSIVWDNLDTDNEKITSFIYYLLHPWEGGKYVATLVKNKLSSILVGFHEDIVGGTESNSSTGMTKYLGFTGYVTSPSLREIDWIDGLLTNYQNMVVYLIIGMCIIICCYMITGQMRPGRAVLGVIFFAFMALIPPAALNYAADKVNLVCDTLYSSKFDYWSYTQLETYLSQLSDVESASSTPDYIRALMNLESNEERGTKNGFSGVRLKWMSPKKIHTGTQANDELTNVLGDDFSTLLIGVLTNSVTSLEQAEDYASAVDATYLYRDIADIFMYAANSYNLYTTFNGDRPIYAVGEGNMNEWDPTDEYPLGGLEYSSGQAIGDYIMTNYDKNTYESDDIYSITSSNMAVGYGFLHDNSMDRSKAAGNYYTTVYDVDESESVAEAGTYNPTVDSYVRQEGGLALGFPFALSETYGKIHENYMALLYDLEDWDTDDSISMDLDTIQDHVYGLDPHTFDLSLNTFRKNASSSGVSSTNTDTDEETRPETDGDVLNRETLSGFYYALYAESPYYFFNNHFRDYVVSHHPDYAFSYPIQSRNTNLYRLFLENQQEYFFNYAATAGDGYGELRDFMGMHDLFYYIIPLLSEGNKIADVFDENFGMYVSEDTQLQITRAGKIRYGGEEYETFEALIEALSNDETRTAGVRAIRDEDGVAQKGKFEPLTPEQRYNLWHDYNVWTIFQSYVPWVDTMEDCHYAKPETIRVAGEKFEVTNPIDPTCYYKLDDSGEMIAGRLMIFSRSEMEFYGLNMGDLTTVEQKIVQTQENVYKQALDLMNYYTLSDEVLINAFSMIQVFEFNKMFSQDSVFGQGYIMYPQGYEAKAFTYDAYLRLVVAQASNEPLQVDSSSEDVSIYRRILKNTSIFFGVALLVNDFMAVYIIPVMKVAILILLFFTSIFLIIGAAIKIELQPIKTIWESLLAPLGSYVLICTGFAWVVSLFMSNGAEGVVKTSTGIRVGDPTTVILLMIFIHIVVVIMLFKVCRKCFKDFKTSLLSVADSITATAIGAAAVVGSTLTGTRRFKSYRTENGYPSSIPSSASQRGVQNTSILGGALGGAVAGRALGADMPNMSREAREAAQRADSRFAARKGLNKYDAKAYDKATAKEDQLRQREERARKRVEQLTTRKGADSQAVKRAQEQAQRLIDKRKAAAKYASDISEGGRKYAIKGKVTRDILSTSEGAGRVAGSISNAVKTPGQVANRIKVALPDVPKNMGSAVIAKRKNLSRFASDVGQSASRGYNIKTGR